MQARLELPILFQSNIIQKKCLNIVITGGNSGIGLQTMRELYFRGHNIIFGSRNQARNQQALSGILTEEKKKLSKAQHFIKSFSLDLSKRSSVQKFAKEVNGLYKQIDILINNAGMIVNKMARNQDDIEMTLAINHFGPFYLTYLLFDRIKDTHEARIINVSSLVHYQAPKKILEDIQCKEKPFDSMQQYQISKFMNVLFTQELFRKMAKKPNLKTVCLHPGIVASNFGSDIWYLKCIGNICCCMLVNNEQGARTSIHLATQEFSKLRNGEYYHSDTQFKQMDQRARDSKMSEDLWKMSEKIYGIKFDI